MSRLEPSLLGSILAVTDGDEPAAIQLARRWENVVEEATAAADRIRDQVARSRCRCVAGDRAVDGRCARCWGSVS